MLLQTIKSRNLWLWGKIITGSELRSSNIKAELQILNQEYNQITPVSEEKQQEAAQLKAEIEAKEAELKSLSESAPSKDWITSAIYTDPFKITALQSIDVTWDNPVGESYGLTANFLQSWHNKPVNITFKGISYMGAFGGGTVGNLNNNDQTSSGLKTNLAAQAISSSISSVNEKISKFSNGSNISGIRSDSSIEGKYDAVVDTDVEKINALLSHYGEGLNTQQYKNGSPYIYLLMENPGSGKNNFNNTDNFVTYVGHIKNFTYSERTDKPFLYDYTVQFVGEPTLKAEIKNAEIHAKQDASSLKLTVIASNSGYSLGYGW